MIVSTKVYKIFLQNMLLFEKSMICVFQLNNGSSITPRYLMELSQVNSFLLNFMIDVYGIGLTNE